MDNGMIRDEIIRQFADNEVNVLVVGSEIVKVRWKRLRGSISWRMCPLRMTLADLDEQPTDVVENYVLRQEIPTNLSEAQVAGMLVIAMKEYESQKELRERWS